MCSSYFLYLTMQAANEGHEPAEEVPMDAQSPGFANESGVVGTAPSLAEPTVKDATSKADDLRAIQGLRYYRRGLDHHRKETDDALHLVESVCRENEEKITLLCEFV